MTSRVRVIIATCLILLLATPLPASAMVGERGQEPGIAGTEQAATVGKTERPSRGKVDGRPADPFGQNKDRERRNAPTSLDAGTVLDNSSNESPLASRVPLPTTVSALYVDSEPESWVGQGLAKVYSTPTSTFSVSFPEGDPELLYINVDEEPGTDFWTTSFAPAIDGTLIPATYEGSVNTSLRQGDQPGLNVGGNGHGCDPTGRFVVHEIERDAQSAVTVFAASFEEHCESAIPGTFGEVRINSDVPVRALQLGASEIHFGTVAVGYAHPRTVAIENVGNASVTIADLSIEGPDAARFAVVDDTCAAQLAPGETCQVKVTFQPSAIGDRSATLVIDDNTFRGQRTVALDGTAAEPGMAVPSGRAAAEVLSIGNGISDVMHADFYTCSSVPCVEPPDPAVAVGPDHVVQAAGGLIRVTSRFGADPMTADIDDWFAQPDDIDGFGDVTVAYNAATDRYFGASTSWYCGSDPIGYLDVGVSATGDPRGIWWIYSFPFPISIPSAPSIGISSDKVVITSREIDISNVCDYGFQYFMGSSLTVVDLPQIVTIPDTLYYFATPPDQMVTAWRPGQSPTGPTSELPLLAAVGGPYNVEFGYATVEGQVTNDTMTLPALTNLTQLGIVPATIQTYPPKDPGGDVGGISNAFPGIAAWRSGRLAVTVDHPCVPTDDTEVRLCTRVVELALPSSPAGTPTLRQDVMVGEKGASTFQGGVAYSGAGDLHLVYSSSSPTRPIGIRHVYQRADDQSRKFSNVATIMAGKAAYVGNAWGDDVLVAQDPVDAFAIWQGHEFATNDGRWGTRVTQVRLPGATFQPVTPARLLDSRTGNGLSGTFFSSVPRTFQITGRGGVPTNAIAVTGNLTVVGQTQAGYVALTPTPTPSPKTSTINFPLADTRANNVTLSLGAGGKLSAVYKAGAGARTHLIFDVTGYFVRNNTGSTYVSLGPVRLLDTRVGNGLNGTFKANMPRSVQITGRGNVPAGAKAISANLTVVGQTGAGYVTLSPTAQTDPTTSTINFPLGDTRANGLTVPLSNDGKVAAVYKAAAGKTTHLILDVTGYYIADLTGSRYVPLNPARTLDSRFNVGLNGTFKSSTPRTLKIDGRRGIPNDADAITGNLTIVGQTGSGYVAITTAPTATPATSTLNAPVGDIRANGVTVPIAADGTDSLTYVSAAGRVTHLILDLTGYFR
jgi:centrosomal CEP192-like protein